MKDAQKSAASVTNVGCHVCGSLSIKVVPDYEVLSRVTSDCKPWPSGGRLCVCQACGCVQKITDQIWENEIESIYGAYSIYHQSEGAEQAVFDDVSGQASARSARLLECLRNNIQLPETGRLLDVGCGNGALLRSFGHFAPLWALAGTELTDKYRSVVECIDNTETLYTCAPDRVPGTFDLITMIHVLEHISAPWDFLTRLRNKLVLDGLLVVELPDYLQNPFDLLIADHCTHFTAATAAELIQRAGFNVISVSTNWVPKELTIVANKNEDKQESRTQLSESYSFDSVDRSLQWLDSVMMTARDLSEIGSFGIFGTSIAATWIFSELRDSVNFFVDEDLHRVRRTYMGCPVYLPQEVPLGSHVFIALPSRLAKNIQTRMEQWRYRFICYIPRVS